MTETSSFSVVVTCGDPAGASPWLLRDLLEARNENESIAVVGPASLRGFLVDRTDALGPGVEWVEAGTIDPDRIVSGSPDADSGEVAYRALEEALKVPSDQYDGLLTLPLSKADVQAAGHPEFVGHTERLEEHFGDRGVMSFFGKELNVALVTRHHPLRDVPEVLTREKLVSTVRTLVDYYENRRDRSPSLALLGLNPHAGEDGRLGSEDRDLLEPVVNSLRNNGIDIEGPVPADGYLPVRGTSVDVIVACYHDQGLIPFKQKHFFDGVHATLGLPVNRVSPDHGIAADRARSGDVDSTSTLNCLRWLRGDPPREA